MKYSHYKAKEIFKALLETHRIPQDTLFYQFIEKLATGYCDNVSVAVNLKETNSPIVLAIADYLAWEKNEYDDVVYFDIERGTKSE